MNLQDFFYVIAIITMSMHIIILIIVVVLLLSIKKKLSETAALVERKVKNVKNFVSDPSILANTVGRMLFGQVLTKVSKILKK